MCQKSKICEVIYEKVTYVGQFFDKIFAVSTIGEYKRYFYILDQPSSFDIIAEASIWN